MEWPPTGTETARDELFRALADGRRRRVLAHLRTEGRTIPVEQIADYVAMAEAAAGGERVSRHAVETTLYHVHLPKLVDSGLAEWADPDRRAAVRVTRLGERLPTALPWLPADWLDG